MRRAAFSILLFLLPLVVPAQSEKDVLRYSREGLHGTARYVGLGGAFGALGGDISSLSSNPAGIGFFRKQHLTFSTEFSSTRSAARYTGVKANDDRFDLGIEQFGYVGTKILKNSPWKSVHFGISYERLRNFEDRLNIQSGPTEHSILDEFVADASGVHLDDLPSYAPFSGELAYQTYLMDPVGDSTHYEHRLQGAELKQNKEVHRSGSMREARLSFGADRGHELYLGGSLGIPVVNFQRSMQHKENVQEGSDVQDFSYSQELSVSGFGLNLQLGAIARPHERWRFGLAFRSPSFLFLEDEWSNRMESNHAGTDNYATDPVHGEHSYRVRTPYRVTASMAHFFEKRGLISAEYRFQDLREGGLSPAFKNRENGYDYHAENLILQNRARPGHSFHIGTEWRFSPLFVRGGYQLATPPLGPEGDKELGNDHSFALGFGHRRNEFLIDVSYKWRLENEFLEVTEAQAPAELAHRGGGVVITGSLRF